MTTFERDVFIQAIDTAITLAAFLVQTEQGELDGHLIEAGIKLQAAKIEAEKIQPSQNYVETGSDE